MTTQNVTVGLPKTLHRRLTQQCRILAQRTGLATRSHVVRLALIEWLEKAEAGAEDAAAPKTESALGEQG